MEGMMSVTPRPRVKDNRMASTAEARMPKANKPVVVYDRSVSGKPPEPDDPRRVGCPTCNARAGAYCKRPPGAPCTPHKARIELLTAAMIGAAIIKIMPDVKITIDTPGATRTMILGGTRAARRKTTTPARRRAQAHRTERRRQGMTEGRTAHQPGRKLR
jgi:hypothetical protein